MLRVPLLARLCAAASLTAACGGPDTATGFTTAAPTTVPGSDASGGSTGTSTGTSTTGTSTSGSSSDSGGGSGGSASSSAAVWDMGWQPDFGGHPPGCQGKIDFLFVISSWYSMGPHQVQLQEAFPAFIDIIKNDFDDFDYHIMVVDSGGASWLPPCDSCYMCIGCEGPGCTDFGGPADYPSNAETTGCDKTEGAGVTLPRNFGASNKRCELAGDNRYIVKGEPELKDTFTCVATLGAGPKVSVPMEIMTTALQPEILSDGGCNEGFLRDEALLVVVIVEGGDAGFSEGTPKTWWEFLLSKKNNDPEAIVALVLGSDFDVPDPVCDVESGGTNELRIFSKTVVHGRFETVCVDSYLPFLQEGADLILDQCALLIPQ